MSGSSIYRPRERAHARVLVSVLNPELNRVDDNAYVIEIIDQTNSGQDALINKVKDGLACLHELSGLTWKQIAVLFNVSMRMVHHWHAGTRPMQEPDEIMLDKFCHFLKRCNAPAFRIRDIILNEVLPNQIIMAELRSPFASDLALAQIFKRISDVKPINISEVWFNAHLPENPLNYGSAEKLPEVQMKTGQTKIRKILKPAKRK